MEPVNRKVAYRLYPTAKQETALCEIKRGHQQLYNAALEQRRAAWKRQRHSVTRTAQEKALTTLRAEDKTIGRLNAQSSQLTLKRLDLAFQAFFRRVKTREIPGYPRFKSLKHFKGWGYKTHGDGWRLEAGEQMRHGHLRLQGVGKVRIRGSSRTPGEPKTCEITHRHGKWYASITIVCHPQRTPGEGMLAFDWDIETFATRAANDALQPPLENPRFLKQSEAALKTAYQERDRKMEGSRAWRKASKKVALLHSKIARQRQDFHHKETAKMVAQAWVIATERLQVRNLARRPKPKPGATDGEYLSNGAKAKAGLNTAILDDAPAQFLGMLRYKAAEAGAVYVEAPTHTLKPSQTCSQCHRRTKKRLQDRWHTCPCGASCHRDINAMWVVYDWAQVHVLSVLLAWVWLSNTRSQELAARHVAQNLPESLWLRGRGSMVIGPHLSNLSHPLCDLVAHGLFPYGAGGSGRVCLH